VTKVRERLAVNKQRLHLNELEGKEQFPVEVSNGFAALEYLDTEVDINSVWEPIGENINISELLGVWTLPIIQNSKY
jgi:hypothetical protein